MKFTERVARVLNAFTYKAEKSKKHKIVEFPQRRIAPKVDEFVDAVYSARSKTLQSRIMLYDHYNQTLTFDNHVRALITKRMENIQGKTIALFDGENQIEDISYFLTAPKFRKYLEDVIMCKFWGMGVFEYDVMDYKGKKWFDYKLIPIKHINPYDKQILVYQQDAQGAPFEGLDEYMFVGDPDDLGLLLPVTLLSLYRRMGMFNYGKYVDLASENFMTLMQREFTDNENIKNIQDQLSKRDGGGMLSLPDGVDIRTENQSSSQQNQLFEGYMNMLKEEMAILILGQTMTTEDGSSKSQAQVHQIEQGQKYSADEKFILDILNYEFIDRLHLWGFEPKNTWEFKFEPTSGEELTKKMLNMRALKELGMEFTNDELRETFKKVL
jgi:hypothetical protein